MRAGRGVLVGVAVDQAAADGGHASDAAGGDSAHGFCQQGDTGAEQRVVFQPPQRTQRAYSEHHAGFFHGSQAVPFGPLRAKGG